MTDWKTLYENLTDSEKDKIAILRVMECSNGIAQHAYRLSLPYALSVEETRRAMKFSMSCMKNMEIPLINETITFAPETKELMRSARNLYVKGIKQNEPEAYKEFMEVSRVSAEAVGVNRILNAQKLLSENLDEIPQHTLQWGVDYLMQFFPE
jgi:hypothetical protein